MNTHVMTRRCPLWMAVLILAAEGGGLAQDPPAPPIPSTVVLTVDFGDGFQKSYTRIPWTKDLTILRAMELAAEHPRAVRFEYRGKGETAFLVEIDGTKNEGRGRNWIYRVNDKLGDRSFGVFVLEPGDIVLWRFGEYNPSTP